ncbi:MAG: hypothetical protein QXG78_03530, partial [Candidatus Methanomethyliaceae archaeon]
KRRKNKNSRIKFLFLKLNKIMRILITIAIICLIFFFVLSFFYFRQKEENINIKEESQTFTPYQVKSEGKEIFIYTNKIEPSLLEVRLGEEIKIINKDSKEHIITFSNPPLEKRILANDIFIYSFSNSGTIEIIDKESGAKATIIVS